MTQRILFRADAKPSIGAGDLASLISLSRRFDARGWETHFAVRGEGMALDMVGNAGLERVLVLPPALTVAEETALLNRHVVERGIQAAVFEITERPLAEYAGLDRTLYKACVCFDAAVPRDFDLIVNWDPGAERLFDPREFPRARLLLGPGHVILPADFDLGAAAARTRRFPPRDILVAMGGADELDLTSRVAAALADSGAKVRLRLVLGPGYAGEAGLQAMLRETSLEYSLARSVGRMFDEYLACDAAVGAGGLTVSELVAARVPAAVVAACAHQVARCRFFAGMGAIHYLGYRSFDPAALVRAVATPVQPAPAGFFTPDSIVEAMQNGLAGRGVLP